MTRVFLAALALLGLTIALAACGGDDTQDDPEAIEEALTRLVTESDLSVRCEGSLSAELLKRLHGDEEGCREHSEGDEPADDAKVTGIEVDGDTATAKLEVVGSVSAGATGTVELVREDGEWQVSDLGVDLLRDLVAAGLDSPASGAQQLAPEVRSCLHQALDDLPDEEFKDYAYDAIGEKPEATTKLQGMAQDCLAAEGGQAPG